jgi:multidrug efflux pump subunit AcrB
VLDHRSVTAVFALIVLISCGLLAVTTTTELAPDEDQSAIISAQTAPAYANIDYLEKYTNQLNKIIQGFTGVEDYFIINGQGGPNNAITVVILKPWKERKKSQASYLADLQNQMVQISGVSAVAFALPSIPSTGNSLPIQFVITATTDYTVIYQVMEKLLAAATKSGLFLFVDSDLKFLKPELEIKIDRNKAASMGINMQNIGATLGTFMGGGYVNRFSSEGQSYQVIPQVPRKFRLNPDRINDFYIPAGNNEMVPLSSVVNFHVEVKPTSLNQFQQLNSATLQGLPMPGKSAAECLEFLKMEAAKSFPAGLTYDFAGQSRQIEQEGHEMIYTFFFALLIIYLVLSAQFESFRYPLIILISVPMSIAGALIPLTLGLATLNIYSGIGLVTLIGLISKHGILLVDFANKIQLNEGLDKRAAIVKSAALRLRPILMTTAAMVLGVVPLIFASGAGAASRFSIGLVIASGMLVGTCFTLFVVPTMYCFFARNHSLDSVAMQACIDSQSCSIMEADIT